MATGRTSVESPPGSLAVAAPTAVDPADASRAASSVRRVRPTTTRRWWLWPHLLGLDAPMVALAWQDWWGRSVHTPLAPGQRAVLGLGVWLIYLADRLADSARGGQEDGTTARHAFAGTHRAPLTLLAALICMVLVWLAPHALPTGQFRGGLVLLAAASAYFWLIHRRISPRWTRHLPKEAVVGGMFALGTAFFVFCSPVPASARLESAIAFFGVTCFLNCALITTWERHPRDRRDPASFLNAFPSLANGGLRGACWVVAAVSGVAAWGWHAVLFVPVALAAGSLATLDRWRGRFSDDALRCLVDLVLLTPCVCVGAAVVFGWTGLFPPL